MRNAGLDDAQAGIKTVGRNINNLGYADDTTLMAESKELKRLLINMKEESEKSGLKRDIQKTKIMVSGPITSGQIDRVKMETVIDFISWAPKSLQTVAAAMKLRHQPRHHTEKQRHHFADKDSYSQSYGLSRSQVWM